MKLVTFVTHDGSRRSGVLIEDGRRIVDLQALHVALYNTEAPALASVLAIAETGQNALDLIAEILKQTAKAHHSSIVARDGVKLDAPIPRPPQMRDFLCFEEHLVQAFRQARIVRSQASANPEAAM